LIRLPPNLRPSEQLFLQDVPRFAVDLLEGSRSSQIAGHWQEAEQSARSVLNASQGAGAQITRGAALIHLADTHLAQASAAAALQEARTAYRLFAAQPSRYQRHNEAVAAYALGLAHHALEDRAAALKWYDKSIDLLERVRLDWSAKKAASRVRCCRRLHDWIRALSECLTRTDASASFSGLNSLWLPLLAADSEARFSLARLDIDGYVVARTFDWAGQAFSVELVNEETQAVVPAQAECYALRVPNQALELLDADDGDYAVIVRRKAPDHEGPGVLETLSGVEFGDFQRDSSGRITFVKPDATVIGGEDIGEDLPVGYVTALLKRTQ